LTFSGSRSIAKLATREPHTASHEKEVCDGRRLREPKSTAKLGLQYRRCLQLFSKCRRKTCTVARQHLSVRCPRWAIHIRSRQRGREVFYVRSNFHILLSILRSHHPNIRCRSNWVNNQRQERHHLAPGLWIEEAAFRMAALCARGYFCLEPSRLDELFLVS